MKNGKLFEIGDRVEVIGVCSEYFGCKGAYTRDDGVYLAVALEGLPADDFIRFFYPSELRFVEDKPEDCFCSVCGDNLYDEENNIVIVGSFGKTEFNICFCCWLKSLGIKPVLKGVAE